VRRTVAGRDGDDEVALTGVGADWHGQRLDAQRLVYPVAGGLNSLLLDNMKRVFVQARRAV
jgi:hypothetical protein